MTRRFKRNVPRETPAPVVHLRVDAITARTWCGRLCAQQDHVHAGDPAAIPQLLPGHRVCRMCERALAKHRRSY